ncbi:MAG: thiamine-phosphate kinase [Candidatus Micrarchaeota archaeon]
MNVEQLGERKIIAGLSRLLRRDPTVYADLDDDAAVFRPLGKHIIVTTDMGVLSTHFTSFDPVKMGRKIVASNVSDVLCKGGLPKYFFLCIGIPAGFSMGFLKRLYSSMDTELEKYGCFFLGGDTNKACEFSYSATLLGFSDSRPLKRGNARTGDLVYLTGEIGNAALGYFSRKKGVSVPKKFLDAQDAPGIDFALCKRILREGKMHSGIDVSDGLAFELHEISRLSGKRIVVEWEKLPLDPSFESLCRKLGIGEKEVALHHGEDYQIVFTGSRNASGISVGRVEEGRGVFLQRNGKLEKIEGRGYEHFKSN